MTPVFHVIEDLLHQPALLPAWSWPGSRAVVIGFVALVAHMVPDMERMVSLTGAVAFSTIGFVLPGLFYLRLLPDARSTLHARRDGTTLWNCAVSVTLIVVGIVGAVVGVWSCFGGHLR